jgi:putative phosphoribosyl transferase
MIFKNRLDAANQLADKLKEYKGIPNSLILALPRGGVPIAQVLSEKLKIPFDTFNVKKIGAPGNDEFAIGAIAENGEIILDDETINDYNISKEYIDNSAKERLEEIKRRIKAYRKDKKLPFLKDKTIFLVDDGIATGYTMKAAILAIRSEKPKEIILAVPVSPPDTIAEMEKIADKVICLETPYPFFAIENFYSEFNQLTDSEVVEILHF